MDSWVDDQNIGAFLSAKSMSKQIQKLEELYPSKLNNITPCLDELSKIEKDNVLNPDVASACFGELLSYVFFFGGIAEMSSSIRQFAWKVYIYYGRCV